MPIYADTDGRLDCCAECGAPAGFEPGSHDCQSTLRPRCTECCNIGQEAFAFSVEGLADVIIAWNLAQRAAIKEEGL